VGVDETRHDDHVGGVDGFRSRGREIGPDRLDAAVAHQDIGAGQDAGLVDGDDGAIPDQIGAPGRHRRGALTQRRRDNGGDGHTSERRCPEQAGEGPAAQHWRLRWFSIIHLR
jgi:hypothetical protein